MNTLPKIKPISLIALFTLALAGSCTKPFQTNGCFLSSSSTLRGTPITIIENGVKSSVDNVRLVDFFNGTIYSKVEGDSTLIQNGLLLEPVIVYNVFNPLTQETPFTSINAPKTFKLEAIRNNKIVGSNTIQAIKNNNCMVEIIKGGTSINIQ